MCRQQCQGYPSTPGNVLIVWDYKAFIPRCTTNPLIELKTTTGGFTGLPEHVSCCAGAERSCCAKPSGNAVPGSALFHRLRIAEKGHHQKGTASEDSTVPGFQCQLLPTAALCLHADIA